MASSIHVAKWRVVDAEKITENGNRTPNLPIAIRQIIKLDKICLKEVGRG